MYKKTRKRTVVAVWCALLFCVGTASFSQEAASVTDASSPVPEASISLSADQSTILLSQNAPAPEMRSPSGVGLFLRMVIVLAIVVALIYAVMRFMRKTTSLPETDDPFLRRVASLSLGAGKSVQVVTLLDHAYLVGTSDAGINLIGEIADKELVDSMNLYADKNSQTKKPRSFSDVLELFMPMAGRGQAAGSGGNAGGGAGTEAAGGENASGARAGSAESGSAGAASAISRLRSRFNGDEANE